LMDPGAPISDHWECPSDLRGFGRDLTRKEG
jgi:hypothetical protein